MTREEIEQYNSMVELFAEVDRRPKNIALCLTKSQLGNSAAEQ